MRTENAIKAIFRRRGYELNYTETLPSTPEDMYELNTWVEDRYGNKYDYRKIYVRDHPTPKIKAFKLLLDQMIGSYLENIKKDEVN